MALWAMTAFFVPIIYVSWLILDIIIPGRLMEVKELSICTSRLPKQIMPLTGPYR